MNYSLPGHDFHLLAGCTGDENAEVASEQAAAQLTASPSFVLEALYNDATDRADALAAAIIGGDASACLSVLQAIVKARVGEVWESRDTYPDADPVDAFLKADREAAKPRCPVEAAVLALATHDYGRPA